MQYCVDAACCYRWSSMVCQSVTVVSPPKMAEPIEMLFGLWTWVSPRNHVLDCGPDRHGEGQFLGAAHCKVYGHCIELCKNG